MTQGLSTAFPGRVFTTPVSEAGIVGVAAGMALRGLRPVVEIMFGDFVTLIADQMINHVSKFRWMYNDQVRVPLVVRTPMGGRRGYGPTHSQTLEKLYLGTPGLRVLAPAALGDPGDLLRRAILENEDPLLFIEHKRLYALPILNIDQNTDFTLETRKEPGKAPTTKRSSAMDGYPPTPSYRISLRGAPPPNLTIAAYGYMAELALKAARRLAYEKEIFAELVVLTQLAPFDTHPILDSTRRTGRLLTVEEGTQTLGWGAELAARIIEEGKVQLKALRRVAARDLPIPASGPLEEAVLPGVDDIIQAAQSMV